MTDLCTINYLLVDVHEAIQHLTDTSLLGFKSWESLAPSFSPPASTQQWIAPGGALGRGRRPAGDAVAEPNSHGQATNSTGVAPTSFSQFIFDQGVAEPLAASAAGVIAPLCDARGGGDGEWYPECGGRRLEGSQPLSAGISRDWYPEWGTARFTAPVDAPDTGQVTTDIFAYCSGPRAALGRRGLMGIMDVPAQDAGAILPRPRRRPSPWGACQPAAGVDDSAEPSPEIVCPITQMVMTDPVVDPEVSPRTHPVPVVEYICTLSYTWYMQSLRPVGMHLVIGSPHARCGRGIPSSAAPSRLGCGNMTARPPSLAHRIRRRTCAPTVRF